MYFANPWGLVALASLPAIVVIHYLRRRYKTRRVAGLFLWGDVLQQRPTGRRWDRLPISPSLLLELLAALALSLLLAQPRIGGRQSVEHVVVVLDSSASMSAEGAGGSLRGRAVEEVLDRIEGMKAGGRVTVLATGTPPRALIGPAAAADVSDARAALADWQPVRGAHSFDPALALGRQVAGSEGTVLFLTDSLPEEKEIIGGVLYRALGSPAGNVGFVSARRDAGVDGSRCFLVLGNYADRPASVRLVGTTIQGDPVVSQPVGIPANRQWRGTINLPADAGTVRFSIDPDALAADNAVVLAPESEKTVRYRNMIADPRVAKALDDAMAAIRGTVRVGAGDTPDIVFAPAAAPPPADPGAWRFLLGPLPAAGEAAYLNTDGPFIIDRGQSASLVRDITLEGAIIGRIAPTPEGNLSPLISAGDRVVLGRRTDTPTPTWVFNADLSPQRSSLVNWTVDWVILLTNLVAERRRSMPGLSDRNFRLGETVVVPMPAIGEESAVALMTPRGEKQELPRPSPGTPVILDDLPITGPYVLWIDKTPYESFAVNLLDERESDLRRATSGEAGGGKAGPSMLTVTDSPHTGPSAWLLAGLIALAAAGLLGNWLYLSKRGGS